MRSSHRGLLARAPESLELATLYRTRGQLTRTKNVQAGKLTIPSVHRTLQRSLKQGRSLDRLVVPAAICLVSRRVFSSIEIAKFQTFLRTEQ